MDMQKLFIPAGLLFLIFFLELPLVSFSQNVGIGTTTPQAGLHVTDSSVLFSATDGIPAAPGNTPVSGPGRRTMWYPAKAAFRTGYVSGTEWDKNNIGNYSFASGFNTKANGDFSTAIGNETVASGPFSTALGLNTTASGYYSMAMNFFNTASGNSSTAMGYNSTASNDNSVAMGYSSISSGSNSISMGYGTNASGNSSVAMGYSTIASGFTSTAIGIYSTASGYASTALGSYVSTSGFTGAFALGDNSTTTVMPSFVANGFRSRFAGGYRLFTSSDVTIGCFLNAGANAWAPLSDVRLKENFEPVDGELFLQKIEKMPLTTWNYKTQDAATFRHYGPMAQDFFAAFGKDSYGTIGCDTLINQQDFLGVNLIAIQALEKRTQKIEQLEKENTELRNMLLQLRKEIDELKFKK